jgi:hypothetical protein
MFLQKATLNGNKTETKSPSRVRRGSHRSPRGLRISVPLALSHGGPDGGSLRFTAPQAELKTQGPNFVSKWKQVRYNEGPQASNVSHLIAITSMTYRCNATNLRKPLGVFSECAAPCVRQTRSGMPHKFVHNSTIWQSLKGPRSE